MKSFLVFKQYQSEVNSERARQGNIHILNWSDCMQDMVMLLWLLLPFFFLFETHIVTVHIHTYVYIICIKSTWKIRFNYSTLSFTHCKISKRKLQKRHCETMHLPPFHIINIYVPILFQNENRVDDLE